MAAKAGDLDDLGPRREMRLPADALHRGAQLGGRHLIHAAAAFADQKDHKLISGVLVRAGDEGVLRRKLVDEAMFEEKIQGTIDGDRRHAAFVAPGQILDEIIGAQRAMGRKQRLQNLAANRRQPRPKALAQGLGRRQRLRGLGGTRLGMVAITRMVVRLGITMGMATTGMSMGLALGMLAHLAFAQSSS